MVGFGVAAALGVMTAAWVASLRRADMGAVDRAWGLAVAGVALACAAVAPAAGARAWLVTGLVTAWGLRLSAYLWWRDRGQGESWRHTQARARWGASAWWRSLLLLFWGQGVAAAAVATPVYAALGAGSADPSRPLGWLDAAGCLVWAAGFGCETAADAQLARFRRARAGADGSRVLRDGLWRWSRHPNYFGDALLWWGLGLVGLAAGPWWALAGPAGMTIVLLRVTGVSAMEQHLGATRGSEHAEYVRSTSAFLPRPPR